MQLQALYRPAGVVIGSQMHMTKCSRVPQLTFTSPIKPSRCTSLRMDPAGPAYRTVRRRQSCRVEASAANGAPTGLRNLEWTGEPYQVQAFTTLKEKMASMPYEISDDEMRWFLLDRKLNVDDTVEKLTKMLRWRREFGADALQTTDVAKEAATGKAYLHTHLDVQNRPVLIVRASKHVSGAAPLIESERLCVFLLDRAMEKMPEGQETILGIFDLRGFTSKNADLGFVRFMVDVFFTYYPKRLSQVLFVDAPWVFTASWNVFRGWLKKYQALVRFVSADEVRREFFTAETVPEDFAGKGFPVAKKLDADR